MPLVQGSLFEGKPLIEVSVSQFIPNPKSVEPTAVTPVFEVGHYRALLDTGADITCLSSHVAAELKLKQSGLIRLIGGSGPNLHPSFMINIGFWLSSEQNSPNSIFQLPEPTEAAAITPNAWFDVLIGTDILKHHELRFMRGGAFELQLFLD